MQSGRPLVRSFSDASFNISQLQGYGKTGIVSGIEIGKDIPCDRLDVSKTKPVYHSSHGAEILACTDADYRCYCLRTAMGHLLRSN